MDWMPPSTEEWSKRNRQALQGLLNINQFLPVTGDIQSGLLAAQDVRDKNYGSAALNALGVLPFLPALGAVTKNIPFDELAKSGQIRTARSSAESLKDFKSGKSDFAELNWNPDNPADDLKIMKLQKEGYKVKSGWEVGEPTSNNIIVFKNDDAIKKYQDAFSKNNPYAYGKLYGYSDADIAKFYQERFGKDAEKMWKLHKNK